MSNKYFLIIIFAVNLIYSQEYNVASYNKISAETIDDFYDVDYEDWFGHSVEGIGDLNGDGVNDIAIGANQDDDGGENKGAIYILFLNEDTSIQSIQKISEEEGGFNVNMIEWDYFGRSIRYLGDLNNDGLMEIAVGAEYDNEAGHRFGGIYIITLNPNGTVFSYQKINQIHGNFQGELDVWDVFGSDIENLGDLNGDGNIDIAIGARRDGDGGEERGAVWVLFLNSDLTVNSHQKISSTSGNLNVALEFQDYFGSSITNIGDLNNDGVIDLAVGAYRDDDGGLNKGAIYILFMNTDGTVASTQKISELEGNFNETLTEDLRFGKSSILTPDINDDGKTELLVGCTDNLFYILNLNSDGTVDSFQKYGEGINGFEGNLNEDDYFGHSVSLNVDLNGKISLITGAYGDSEFGYQKGAAWILHLGEILSIDEIGGTQNTVFLYPNPSKNSFSINDLKDVSNIQIFDINGRLVVVYDNLTRNLFDASYLPVGEYLIKTSLENGSFRSYKLIKQ